MICSLTKKWVERKHVKERLWQTYIDCKINFDGWETLQSWLKNLVQCHWAKNEIPWEEIFTGQYCVHSTDVERAFLCRSMFKDRTSVRCYLVWITDCQWNANCYSFNGAPMIIGPLTWKMNSKKFIYFARLKLLKIQSWPDYYWSNLL